MRQWGPIKCWGSKYLGSYENERYITVTLFHKIGCSMSLLTDRDNLIPFTIGAKFDLDLFNHKWIVLELSLYRWTLRKTIFITRHRKEEGNG